MYDTMELALNLNLPCFADKKFTIVVFPIEASLADDAVEVLDFVAAVTVFLVKVSIVFPDVAGGFSSSVINAVEGKFSYHQCCVAAAGLFCCYFILSGGISSHHCCSWCASQL
jgi:hypothetical protein